MDELIWSHGEKPEKSMRNCEKSKEELISDNLYIKEPKNMTDLEINFSEFRMSSNKRELSNNKLNERYLTRNNSQNPFLSENNYIKDLEMQQKFLIPKASN